MKTILLILLPIMCYCQTEETRLLFLSINDKRTELKYPKLSYQSSKQSELDTRAIKVGVEDRALPKDKCSCTTETVFAANSFKELVRAAIDKEQQWYHLDPKEINAAISVVNLDGKYYAVVRTY
jgi:hypothetical protein